jgi:hypothetical protein
MRIQFALVALIALVGCGKNASVEFGMNDETLLDGAAGDLRMRVLKVEIPEGGDYVTAWEGIEQVQVELQESDFVSITNGYEAVEPRAYSNVRVTVDSLIHIQQTVTTPLIDTALTFVAQAFSPIVISDGDELKLVVAIAAEVWFDEDSIRIVPGHEPFENAALRIYYDY